MAPLNDDLLGYANINNGFPNEPRFTKQQNEIIYALELIDPELSKMYKGAIWTLNDTKNPEYLVLVAHSLRELMEKLPRKLSLPNKITFDIKSEFCNRLKAPWINYKKNIDKNKSIKYMIFDSTLNAFLESFDKFHNDFESFESSNKEIDVSLCKALDISRYRLPDIINENWVNEWISIKKFFVSVSHHHSTTTHKFAEMIIKFEGLLYDKLIPTPFDDQATIISLICEFEKSKNDDIFQNVLKLIKKNGTNYAYFFDNIKSPDWIIPLLSENYFKYPIQAKKEGNNINYDYWSESKYLARISPIDPKLVCDTIIKMDNTDNFYIRIDYLNAACHMPPEFAKNIAENEIKFIERNIYINMDYAEQCVILIQHLISQKEITPASKLLRSLMRITQYDTKISTDGLHKLPYTIKYRQEDYNRIFELIKKTFIQSYPKKWFESLCYLLYDLVNCYNNVYHAYPSHFYRQNIDDHINFLDDDLDDILINSICEVSDVLLEQDDLECFSILRKFTFNLFKRIEIHLRNKWFSKDKEGATLFIEKLDFENNLEIHNELLLFIESYYLELSNNFRNRYKNYIKNKFSNQEGTKEQYERRNELKYLSSIKQFLSDSEKIRTEELEKEFGILEQIDYRPVSKYSWIGYESSLNAEGIEKMSIEELIEFLNNWKPQNDHYSPSPEGLGRLISEDIKKCPEKYILKADLFIETQPTYIKSFFFGIYGVIDRIKNFDKVLNLIEWTIDQEDSSVTFYEGRTGFDYDNSFSESRRWIAFFIEKALSLNGDSIIPFNYRERIWRLITRLLEEENKNVIDEHHGINSAENEDITDIDEKGLNVSFVNLYDRIINTTKGNAFQAIFYYSLWVLNHLQLQNKENLNLSHIEEVQVILEKYLDNGYEDSFVMRSVFGYCYPLITVIDKDWAVKNLDVIFPLDKTMKDYFWAAWNGYIRNPYYSDVFPHLKKEYEYAITHWKEYLNNDNLSYLLKQLLNHIYSAYLYTDMDIYDVLIKKAINISTETAYYITERFGSFLNYDGKLEKSTLPQKFIGKLISYWEYRKQSNPTDNELAAFKLWFTSGKFEKQWAIDNLHYVLKYSQSSRPSYYLFDTLLDYIDDYPQEVIQCIRELLHKGKFITFTHNFDETMQNIVSKLLSHEDPNIRQNTEWLINEFAYIGITYLRNLLPKV